MKSFNKNKMKRLIILFTISVLGLVAIYFIMGSKSNIQEKIITNYNLETPNILDKNLAQFYLWTIEDPLLLFKDFKIDDENPGSNVGFSMAVLALENEENLYMQNFTSKEKLFPIQFLKDLINVSKYHQDFVKTPTWENAMLLISYYNIAVKDYKQAAIDLKMSTKNLVPGNIGFNGINTVMDANTFYNDMDKIISNADVLTEEIKNRQICLEQGIGCVRPVNDFSNFKLLDRKDTFKKEDILPKELFATDPGHFMWRGPYIASTECFGWSNDFKQISYPFYIIKYFGNSFLQNTQLKFKLDYIRTANNIIYRVPSDAEKAQYGSKIKLIPLSGTRTYLCPDYSLKSKLNSINFLYIYVGIDDDGKDQKIFTNLLKLEGLSGEAKNFFLSGQKLEQKFFDAQLPSEVDADNLVNYYGLLYQKILLWMQKDSQTQNVWLKPLFNNRLKILNVYLEYKRGLHSAFQGMFILMDDLRSVRLQNKKLGNDIKSLDSYMYLTRSGWGLLFFPFSKSFYRLDSQPDYILKTKVDDVGVGKHYIDYKQAIKQYSLDDIKSWSVFNGRNN